MNYRTQTKNNFILTLNKQFSKTPQRFLPLLNDAPKGAIKNSFLAPVGAIPRRGKKH